MRKAGGERGQGTVEYLAVIALVVLLLAIGTLAAAPGIANAVMRGVQHALCLVRGGDCLATERRPCVIRADARDETVTVHAALIRIGHHAGVLREELSDGTVRVTEIDDVHAAASIGVGAHGRVAVGGGVDVRAGAGVSAEAGGWLGHTRTFTVRDQRAANALIDRLRRGSHGTLVLSLPRRIVGSVAHRIFGGGERKRLPEPDDVGFAGGLDGAAATQFLGTSGDLQAALSAALGGIWEPRTGRRTFYVEVAGEAAAALRGAFAAAGLRAGGAARAGVTLDRRGRPLQLAVLVAADGEVGLDLAAAVPRDAPHGGDGTAIELEALLDLGVDANAAAVRRFLTELRGAKAAAAASHLAGRLARHARLDVRAYSTSSSSRGVGGDVALGAKAGAELDLSHSSARLRAAWSRPAGGVWERRVECLQA